MQIQPLILYALTNTFFTAFGLANFKYLSSISTDAFTTLAECLVLAGLVAFIYLIFNVKNTLQYNKTVDNKKLFKHMCLFVIFIFTTRYCFIKSVETSPNVGYTHMIVNLNAIISVILAYFLFNQTINIKTFLGIILCILGLFVIIKYS